MIELIQALEKVLERGVIVEPIWLGDYMSTTSRPAYRIRLESTEQDARVPRPDPTIPDNATSPRGGLTW